MYNTEIKKKKIAEEYIFFLSAAERKNKNIPVKYKIHCSLYKLKMQLMLNHCKKDYLEENN